MKKQKVKSMVNQSILEILCFGVVALVLNLSTGCGLDEPPPFVDRGTGLVAEGHDEGELDVQRADPENLVEVEDAVLEDEGLGDVVTINTEEEKLDDESLQDLLQEVTQTDDVEAPSKAKVEVVDNTGDDDSQVGDNSGTSQPTVNDDEKYCSSLLGTEAKVHVAGSLNDVQLSGAEAGLLKVTGNQNQVSINVSSTDGDLEGLCIFVSGNQSKVSVNVKAVQILNLAVVLRGNQTKVELNLVDGGNVAQIVEDIKGNNGKIIY